MALTLRATKGSELSYTETDNNFSGLADGSLWSVGAANRVLYKNGSNVGAGSANLIFDGTTLTAHTLTVSTGALTANALVDISAAGAGQVKFPASQNASANANTLDDYEEGAWTPDQGSGLTLVGGFSSSGTYIKIGRHVFVTGQVSGATSVAAAAAGVISSNLPFTVGSNSGVGSATNGGLTASIATLANTTTTDIYACTALAASAQIRFSATYQV